MKKTTTLGTVILVIFAGEKNAALLKSLHDREGQLFVASAKQLTSISQSLSKSLLNARVSDIFWEQYFLHLLYVERFIKQVLK